ncbi:MAG: [protein-PII] uridylyltransferase, partial [Burkholderiaceae bacterium]|nr:[protein-PII] uridylyltransferase [Burkholderiaceae bacterium]
MNPTPPPGAAAAAVAAPCAATAARHKDLAALRARYRDGKQALLAELAQNHKNRNINPILRRLAQLTDEILCALYSRAGLGEHCALVAVGGFGRGELFPYSDIDVLVLLPDGGNSDDAPPLLDEAARKAALEAFITSCWDAGLEIGSSVRTTSECLQAAAADITIRTALVEARQICGSTPLFQDAARRFIAQLDPLEFMVAKTLEMRQRHAKFEDTPYALEPNCKESPGGLRDLQIILWITRAAGLGTTWSDLHKNGLSTAREARQLARNERLLGLIRARLHLIARRREDRLVFDLQTAAAESFGYRNIFSDDGRLVKRASEQLMQRYYWCAKAVMQLNLILLQVIEERLRSARAGVRPARRIDQQFLEKNGMLEIRSDDLYQRDPHAILRTFLVFEQQVGIKNLSARTLRALYNVRTLMDSRFRADAANHATFMRILKQPSGITHAFRLMNQTSVLGRYLWPFRGIVGQMQHDLFHIYTVDQHILMVLRNIRCFFIPEHAHEYPFCSQLAAGWDKPWVLYAAALFHDIAKGRGGDHSELGAQEARLFCQQHGVARRDAGLIEFLVREHLTMSRVAQKEDVCDPDAVGAFARRVGTVRRLTALYLLTVADIRGTSPKVWNAWKGKLLEDLYKATLHVLGGRVPDANALVEARKRKALEQLVLDAVPAGLEKPLWDTLDAGYFMRHDSSDIAWHTRLLAGRVAPGAPAASRAAAKDASAAAAANATTATDTPVVRARFWPHGEGLQVLVYTRDRPDLFARICGAFDRMGYSILDARIHTTRNGYALDTFQIVTETLPDHYRELIHMVEAELPAAITSTSPLPAPRLGRVSRRVKSFPITARVDLLPDDKAQRWLLSVSASDRTGLLYSIARV